MSVAHYSCKITGRFDSELVSLLPPSVKFISHTGAGYDSIDAVACAERGKFHRQIFAAIASKRDYLHKVFFPVASHMEQEYPYQILRALLMRLLQARQYILCLGHSADHIFH